MALVHRTDNSDVSDSDESALNSAIKQLQVVERDLIGPYVEFSFRIGGSHRQNGGQGFCVNFTEYWLGDDEGTDGLDPEVILARDAPLVQQCCNELARILGDAYSVELICDHW